MYNMHIFMSLNLTYFNTFTGTNDFSGFYLSLVVLSFKRYNSKGVIIYQNVLRNYSFQ